MDLEAVLVGAILLFFVSGGLLIVSFKSSKNHQEGYRDEPLTIFRAKVQDPTDFSERSQVKSSKGSSSQLSNIFRGSRPDRYRNSVKTPPPGQRDLFLDRDLNSDSLTINLIDTLYIAFQLLDEGVEPWAILTFLKGEFSKRGQLFTHYYWHTCKPASKRESPAVYGLAIDLAYRMGEPRLAKELGLRLAMLRHTKSSPGMVEEGRPFKGNIRSKDQQVLLLLRARGAGKSPFYMVDKEIRKILDLLG